MPNVWNNITFVPVYKNKGDIHTIEENSCVNDEVLERIIEHKLLQNDKISTTKTVYLLDQFIERFQEKWRFAYSLLLIWKKL